VLELHAGGGKRGSVKPLRAGRSTYRTKTTVEPVEGMWETALERLWSNLCLAYEAQHLETLA